MGDQEQAEIISMFAEGLGDDKIGEMIHCGSRIQKVRSDKHNKAVTRVGYCSICKRVKGQFETLRV